MTFDSHSIKNGCANLAKNYDIRKSWPDFLRKTDRDFLVAAVEWLSIVLFCFRGNEFVTLAVDIDDLD